MRKCNIHGVLPIKLNYTALEIKPVVVSIAILDAVFMTSVYAVQMDLALALLGSVEFVCYI